MFESEVGCVALLLLYADVNLVLYAMHDYDIIVVLQEVIDSLLTSKPPQVPCGTEGWHNTLTA